MANISTIIIGAVIALGGWVILTYNSLVQLKNRVKEAWADIDVQLKRRYDLVPNLVETVKGYAKHEQETLAKVVEMRTLAMQGGTMEQRAQHENMLTGALKSIFALSEAYPDLKANQNFLELQRELTDTENKIQAARRFYNGTVRDFNTKIEQIPTNIVAKFAGFKAREFFELSENEQAAREPVKVDFNKESTEPETK